MNSILSKFVLLIISALLFLSVSLGGFSLYITNKITKEDSEALMKEACKQQALALDYELGSIEQAVLSINDYAQCHLKDYNQLYDKDFEEAYSNDICELAVNISEHTPGAMAVYLRYNPEIVGHGRGGFFRSRKSNKDYFEYEVPTDILEYSADDVEHVGWYYIPIQNKKAIWMDPYYNKNLNVLMISFVVPLYSQDMLVGVLGMDIDFSVFIDIAQDISLYETGFAEIACVTTNKVYYRQKGDSSSAVFSAVIPQSFHEDLISEDSPDQLLEYNYKGISDTLCLTYQTLSNSMRILVMAPKGEINHQRNTLIHYIVLLSVSILVLGTVVTVLISRRITRPLKSLTVAADHYRHGDWGYKVECKTKDEVYTLINTMEKMAGATQKYINQMNNMAYKDALTGVKNKASYLNYVEHIKGENIDYAVVIIDLNELKNANDNYGHEEGDILIVETCRLICHVFDHSPVFRIGGDEFCIVLTDEDYSNRKQLFKTLRGQLNYKERTSDGKVIIAAASGMGVFEEDGVSYNEVFQKADERMYENKKEMKAVVR